MKILYTNFHESPGIGGHTSYILRLAGALAAAGHEIAVAAPAGSSLHRLAAGIPGVAVHAQAYPNRPGRLGPARARMRTLLREGAFDIVHVNGSPDHRLVMLASLGLPKRPRIVFTKHNDLPIGRLGAWIRARLATDHVIAVCDYVARLLQDSPYRRCGITTVANGVDTDHFAPSADDEARALQAQWAGAGENRALLLGSNAGTEDYKGWIDLVRAVRRLSEPLREKVRIVVAGAPPPQPLWDEVAACGLAGQVSYAGRLEDVRPMLAALDIGFVLSYRIETISFACREMMAMGKPVIVTRHAGLPENISDGVDGWVVAPRDPEALAGLLARILTGGCDLAAMGRSAREKSVREFGLQRFVSGTEQVYRQLADPGAAAAGAGPG